MTTIPNEEGSLSRVLLLGGTSEIGLAILSAMGPGPGHALGAGTEVIIAGRDPRRLETAGKSLNLPGTVTVMGYDAMDTASHQAFVDEVCAGGAPDLVIAAAGVLFPQREAERDVRLAATMIETNFTAGSTAEFPRGRPMIAKTFFLV
jgi:decaprenylphospho-beta-D-erythro-pentofuranosid-2-ulose 2-reductase